MWLSRETGDKSRWRAQQRGVITTQHQSFFFFFFKRWTSFKPPSLSWRRDTVSQQDFSQKVPPFLDIWFERICYFTLVMSAFLHVFSKAPSASQLKWLYWKKKKRKKEATFQGWQTLTANEAKLGKRECTYRFTALFFFFCLFICLFVAIFLLGWVPSNPTYVLGMFFFVLLMAWQKEKSVLLHFLDTPPLLHIKAPGLLNKLICGPLSSDFHWCVCACVCVRFLAFFSNQQRWPRLWQSAAAPPSPWNRGTSMCVLTHKKHNWHTITCSPNRRGRFYLALNSVVSCPTRLDSDPSRHQNTRKNAQWNSLNVPWRWLGWPHMLYASLYMHHLSSSPCSLHVSALIVLKSCFFFFSSSSPGRLTDTL